MWGGGGREQSSSISRFLGNSGALSALKQIVHISSYLERLFHSVISNSVYAPICSGGHVIRYSFIKCFFIRKVERGYFLNFVCEKLPLMIVKKCVTIFNVGS